MKYTLHNLDITEVHVPNFDCDIDTASDHPAGPDQDTHSGPISTPPTENENLTTNCHLCFLNGSHHHLATFPAFHSGIH